MIHFLVLTWTWHSCPLIYLKPCVMLKLLQTKNWNLVLQHESPYSLNGTMLSLEALTQITTGQMTLVCPVYISIFKLVCPLIRKYFIDRLVLLLCFQTVKMKVVQVHKPLPILLPHEFHPRCYVMEATQNSDINWPQSKDQTGDSHLRDAPSKIVVIEICQVR